MGVFSDTFKAEMDRREHERKVQKIKLWRDLTEKRRQEMFPPFDWSVIVMVHRGQRYEQHEMKPVWDYVDDLSLSKELVGWAHQLVRTEPASFSPTWSLGAPPQQIDFTGMSKDLQDAIVKECAIDERVTMEVYG